MNKVPRVFPVSQAWLTAVLMLFLIACAGGATPNTRSEGDTAGSQATLAAMLGGKTADPAEQVEIPATLEVAVEAQAQNGDQPIVTNGIPGRIAYITPQGGLATVAPDGSNTRTLASTGIFQFPAWSPQSNTVAVIGTNPNGSGVFVIADNDERKVTEIYSDRRRTPIYLYWTPNGKEVSFIARDPGGLALHLAPADGTAASSILSKGQPFFWQWLDSGERILVHTSGSSLYFLDRNGNEDATGVGQNGIFQAPALSADGRFLAFSDAGEEDKEGAIAKRVLIVNELAGGAEKFHRDHRGIVAMSWSPTRSLLAFISPSENQATFIGPLTLLNAETGETQLLVRQNVIAFFWSPDGRKLAYITLSDSTDQAKGVVGKPMVQRQRPLVVLSMIDVETLAQRSLLHFQPTPLFVTQFIPFFDQYALSHRIWSPDSQFVVLPTVSEEQEQEVMVIPIDGSTPTVVGNGTTAFWSQR